MLEKHDTENKFQVEKVLQQNQMSAMHHNGGKQLGVKTTETITCHQ